MCCLLGKFRMNFPTTSLLSGIITNYRDLRQFLLNKGHGFSSDTDTEVIAVLLREVTAPGTPAAAATITNYFSLSLLPLLQVFVPSEQPPELQRAGGAGQPATGESSSDRALFKPRRRTYHACTDTVRRREPLPSASSLSTSPGRLWRADAGRRS